MNLRTVAIPALLFLPLLANTGQDLNKDSVAHGTINIVLGNENGLVVLTDSMLSSGSKQLPEPGQKLFRLDDRTVCTIAGFVSAPTPVQELNTSTSAIISEYRRQSLAQAPLSIAEKTRVLGTLFELYLSGTANMRDAAAMPTPLHQYVLELIVAGYDLDGVPKIAKIVMGMHPFRNGISPNPTLLSDAQDFSISNVNKKLVWKLGGQPDVAERLLQDPDAVEADTALHAYAASLHENDGQSLTVHQMVQLAKRLAYYTAERYPSVGGANQIAVIQGGRIAKFEQQAFAEPPKGLHYALVVNVEYDDGFDDDLPPPVLFVRCKWTRMRSLTLDGRYFIGNVFTHSILTYDGGGGDLGQTNEVNNSGLVIGPDAKQDDEIVRHLAKDFHWLRVLRQDLKAQP
jgi:20S proteasome alpha/beta subunit